MFRNHTFVQLLNQSFCPNQFRLHYILSLLIKGL